MNISDLTEAMLTFVRIADTGSVTAAARSLGITPSSVSRRLHMLEQQVGATLVARNTRGSSLTEAGQLYLEKVVPLLAAMAEIHQPSQAAHPCGRLRVTAPVAFGHDLLTDVTARFTELYPDAEVDLLLNDDRLDLVRMNIDLAFRMGTLPDSTLLSRRIAPVRRVLCASPDLLARCGPLTGPEDLQRLDAVVIRGTGPSTTLSLTGPQGTVTAVTLRSRVSCSTSLTARDLVCAGVGIAVMPTWLAGADLQAGRLVPVLSGWIPRQDPPSSAIWALYPPGRATLPKVSAFLDLFQQSVGTPPVWDRI